MSKRRNPPAKFHLPLAVYLPVHPVPYPAPKPLPPAQTWWLLSPRQKGK